MTAAAMFAVAYGFPPSACKGDEAVGLLANMERALAMRGIHHARGSAAASSVSAFADLVEASFAPPWVVVEARMAAMRSEAGGMQR
jgi:hypothetical protein